MLEVRLLGAFEVRSDEGLIHISGRHEQSLFAYLLLNGNIIRMQVFKRRRRWKHFSYPPKDMP